MRLFLDDSKMGSETTDQPLNTAELEAEEARGQFFQDETADEFDGADYEGSEENQDASVSQAQDRNRKIQEAKKNSPKKSTDQSDGKKSDVPPAGRSTSPRKKLAREDAEKPSGFNSLPETENRKKLLKDSSKKPSSGGEGKTGASDAKKKILPAQGNVKNVAKGPSAIGGLVMDDEKWGEHTGDALFLIWSASAVIGSIPFVITGIPGLIMLNLLLISPKLAYRITIWILIFIPVVGEFAKGADEVNAGKKHITIRQLEKTAIIFIDIAWLIVILCVVAFIMAIACYSVNSMGTVQSGAAQVGEYLWYGTSLFGELKSFCTGV